VGYPLLIAASGLFFRVRLVWFTTLVSILSYAFLVFLGVEHATRLYPVIFAASLGVVRFIMAYQVERVRILTRYEQRRNMMTENPCVSFPRAVSTMAELSLV
jgi:serine/threonine-protein kinase